MFLVKGKSAVHGFNSTRCIICAGCSGGVRWQNADCCNSLIPSVRAFSVFLGALLAFLLTTGIAVAIGDALAFIIPTFWICLAAAAMFLIFGIYTLVQKEDEAKMKMKEVRSAVFSSFSLITLMELGDKTQFAVIALSAEYEFPFLVYLGVMVAFILITALGIIFGAALTRFVPLRYIRLGSGIVFLLFGVVFLITAVVG